MQTKQLGGVGLGSNGKVYANSLLKGSKPFYGNQSTTVVLAKSIGKNLGYATLGAGILLELGASATGEQSWFRFGVDVGAMGGAWWLGGWPGILAGGIYSIGMSEFDRKPDGPGWNTGNMGLNPSDNTRTYRRIK
ncbi:MAG: hypothetical protein KIT33_12595 [Candidatus Kapabacteria bacterium]|nr:hypothetical protein [Ignavibacteriota bacterium]MCW5885799.1 hypothetical protein [Candidatus Kapabacteria bacterium]